MDQTNVSVYINLAREIRAGNAEIINAPNLSTARGIMDRKTVRRDASIARDATKAAREILGIEEPPPSVLNEDFVKWAPTYTGDKFNFIHCDFPYGIDTDKRQQGNAVAIHGGYDDSEETYWRLVKALCDNLDRFCDESAHIMFWFHMHFYQDTLDYFANHRSDIVINPIPLIWHKSDGKGILSDPQRGPRHIYETCLFGSRGDRPIVRAKADVCSMPTAKGEWHPTVKPEPVLREFFRMFVDDNTRMLDPTCGSGTALRAANALDAARVLGLEIDPKFAADAELKLAGTRDVITRPANVAL